MFDDTFILETSAVTFLQNVQLISQSGGNCSTFALLCLANFLNSHMKMMTLDFD